MSADKGCPDFPGGDEIGVAERIATLLRHALSLADEARLGALGVRIDHALAIAEQAAATDR